MKIPTKTRKKTKNLEKRKKNILLVSSDEDADDDMYQLTKEDESLNEEMWLEIMEILATFGTIGGGIAAIALGELYLCSLVVVLPHCVPMIGLRTWART